MKMEQDFFNTYAQFNKWLIELTDEEKDLVLHMLKEYKEEALNNIWHGPDVVPPTGLKVWGDDGQIYYFSCVSSKALPSNGMWIADYGSSQKPKKPKHWRYPEPIKIT